jgi:perosamine synthetase
MIGLIPAENWEYSFSDMVSALSVAFRSRKELSTLRIDGIGDCIPARSARAAIVTAISALNLPSGAHIGVPLYCCPVVFKAVKAAGCIPHFIDVERATACMSPSDLSAKQSQIDAVIAVHMFGNLCDMFALREAVNGKPIIEDCAQSLGSKLNGHMAGSFGDISVFSFRSGKYLTVGEGGALFSNRAEINIRLSRLVRALPANGRMDECAHIARTYLRTMLRRKPLYGLVGHALWSIYNNSVEYSTKTPIVFSQIYLSDLALSVKRLSLLSYAIEEQRANADFFSRNLKFEQEMLYWEQPGSFYNRYLYPIIVPTPKQRDLMAAYLKQRQIDTSKPYSDIADIATKHYGYAGDCPVAEETAKKVLVIPSYYRLNKKVVVRIVECLNASWEEIRGRARARSAMLDGLDDMVSK